MGNINFFLFSTILIQFIILIIFIYKILYLINKNLISQIFNENREYITRGKIFKSFLIFMSMMLLSIFFIIQRSQFYHTILAINNKYPDKQITIIANKIDTVYILLILMPIFVITLYAFIKLIVYIILRVYHQKNVKDFDLLKNCYRNKPKDIVVSFNLLYKQKESQQIDIVNYLNECYKQKLIRLLVKYKMNEEALFLMQENSSTLINSVR